MMPVTLLASSPRHKAIHATLIFAMFLICANTGCPGDSSLPPLPDDGAADSGDAADGPFKAGDTKPEVDTVCVPSCTGKNCGSPDGCGGACQTGACTSGLACQKGVCACSSTSCTKGCCKTNLCFPGTSDDHCGSGGTPCTNCLIKGLSCGSSQTCISCTPSCAGKKCGAPNGCGGICSTGACPLGQTCSGGQCVCTAVSCPTGCCSLTHTCYPGTSAQACGSSGGLCNNCSAQGKQCYLKTCKVCSCSNKTCGASDGCGGTCLTGLCPTGQTCSQGICVCTPASCPTGCCSSSKTCYPGTSISACGTGGGLCANCSAQGKQCYLKTCKVCSCSNKKCGGPDGCGGTCASGTCPSGQTCSQGTCVCTAASCPTGCCNSNKTCSAGTSAGACGSGGGLCANCSALGKQCYKAKCKDCGKWSVSTPGLIRGLAVDTDGTIYASGKSGSKVYVAALDSCGTILKSTTYLPTSSLSAAAGSLALSGQSVYIGGTAVPNSADPLNGLFAIFAKKTLSLVGASVLVGSTGQDEIWDITIAGGAVWMSGTTNFGSEPRAWGVKGALTSTTACGFSLLTGSGSSGCRNLIAPAGSGYVYFTGGGGGKGFIARRNTSSCSVSPCTSCPAAWQLSFQDGSYSTDGRDLVLAGGSLYVAGFSLLSSTDTRGVVFRIDLATGKTLGTYLWNPSTLGDGFLALTTDGTSLYVAGSKGINLSSSSGGTATVTKLSLPSMKVLWEKTPGDKGMYWNVALAGSNGLLLAGGVSAGAGVVRRCLTSGVCL